MSLTTYMDVQKNISIKTDLSSENNTDTIEEANIHLELKKNTIIDEIALTALKEMGVSLVFSAVACLFVATPIGMATLVVGNLALIVFGAFIRIAITSILENEREKNFLDNFPNLISFLKTSPNVIFAVTNLVTRSVLFHEFGHALAAKALYDTKVTVELFPFIGGVQSRSAGPLTSLGSYFDHKTSDLLVTAAGPAVNLITSVALVGLAHYYRESQPELSRYLNVMAALEVFSVTIYALSAFCYPMPGHDFIRLAAGGIPPLVSTVVLLGVPVIFKLGLMLADHLKKEDNKENSIQ